MAAAGRKGMDMSTKPTRNSRTWLSIIAALGLLAGLAQQLPAEETHERRGCSVRTLEGTYGFYRTGKGAFGGPLAGQGIVHFDGAGSWSAVVNNSRDGEISLDEEFAGLYTVAANCTAALLDEAETETDRIVVVDDGNGFYGLNVIDGITIYTVATKIQTNRGH